MRALPAGLRAIGLLLAAWLMTGTMAMACNWPMSFAAVGQSQSTSLVACDSLTLGAYGGAYLTLGFDAMNDFGLGAADTGASFAERATGTQGGEYEFLFNTLTGLATVKLITAPTSSPDTLTVYTYMGPETGSNWFTNTTNTFTFTYDPPSSNANLSGLSLSAGTLSPGFAAGTPSYTASVSGATTSITVTPTVGDSMATVNVNGVSNVSGSPSGAIALNVGSNPISVLVTAEDGATTKSYTVDVTRSPTVPGAPVIGTATAGDSQVSVTLTAPSSNGGAAITTYTATASPGGAWGTAAGPAAPTITVAGLDNGTAYTFTVTATNAIGTSVASAPSNSATPKGNQTITFMNPGARNFGTSPAMSASASSGLPVSFTSVTTGVCANNGDGTLTLITAGSCTIDADQNGNGVFNAAGTVTQTFAVNAIVPGAPTVGTATAGDTQADVTFTAPASTGGAAVVASGYTVTANPGGATATGSSSPITVTGLTNGVSHTFTVTATNSAGTGAASAPTNSVTPRAPQFINFFNPGSQNFGTTPSLTANTTAGLLATFTSSTTGVCTITAEGALTFVAAGTCTINADHYGNVEYLPTSQVSQSFTVSPVAPGAPSAAIATAGDTQASVAFTAPASTGAAAITGYTVTVSPADVAPVNGASSPILVMGLTNGQAYTFTVTATNSSGTGSASAASNSVTPAATQTITFATPSPQNFGTSPTFTATADSGLTPTFTSSSPGVCTITPVGAVTFVTTGTCIINADQAGNGSYLPANQVTRSFTVNAVEPGAPTGAAASIGDMQASVAFAAPVSNGGSPITEYTVTSDPDGITAAGTSSPVVVTGLTNGTSYTFTVTAKNAAGTSAASAASSPATPFGASLVLSPGSGALPDAMAEEGYGQTIAVSGQSGAVLYAISGSSPAGLVLNVSTGELTGPLGAGSEGDYAFTVTAEDSSHNTGSANFTLKVLARTVTAADQAITVPPGSTPVPVDLVQGATGGPFTDAAIVTVEPSNAGTAQITRASVAANGPIYPNGIYLRFTPNPQFTGRAVITYRLISLLGTSNDATIVFNTQADMDAVAEAFSTLSRNFVTTRSGLLAGIVNVPGLQQRRGMGSAKAPGNLSGTANGNSATINFAASSLELEAFQAISSATSAPVDTSRVNFWIDGTATLHVRSNGGPDNWGSFAVVSGGADVLVNDDLLVGLAVHTDWMDDLTKVSRINGRGVMVGPYVSTELLEGLYLDASVYYGHSWNTIETGFFGGAFETNRLLANVRLEGEWALSDLMVLRPSINVFYLREAAGEYEVSDSLGAATVVDAFVTEQLRLSGGGRLEHRLDMGEGVTAIPFGSLQLGLMVTDGSAAAFGNIGLGFDLLGIGAWSLGVGADAAIDGDGLRSISAKARAGVRF